MPRAIPTPGLCPSPRYGSNGRPSRSKARWPVPRAVTRRLTPALVALGNVLTHGFCTPLDVAARQLEQERVGCTLPREAHREAAAIGPGRRQGRRPFGALEMPSECFGDVCDTGDGGFKRATQGDGKVVEDIGGGLRACLPCQQDDEPGQCYTETRHRHSFLCGHDLLSESSPRAGGSPEAYHAARREKTRGDAYTNSASVASRRRCWRGRRVPRFAGKAALVCGHYPVLGARVPWRRWCPHAGWPSRSKEQI